MGSVRRTCVGSLVGPHKDFDSLPPPPPTSSPFRNRRKQMWFEVNPGLSLWYLSGRTISVGGGLLKRDLLRKFLPGPQIPNCRAPYLTPNAKGLGRRPVKLQISIYGLCPNLSNPQPHQNELRFICRSKVLQAASKDVIDYFERMATPSEWTILQDNALWRRRRQNTQLPSATSI